MYISASIIPRLISSFSLDSAVSVMLHLAEFNIQGVKETLCHRHDKAYKFNFKISFCLSSRYRNIAPNMSI